MSAIQLVATAFGLVAAVVSFAAGHPWTETVAWSVVAFLNFSNFMGCRGYR